jgi:hypothetical protein
VTAEKPPAVPLPDEALDALRDAIADGVYDTYGQQDRHRSQALAACVQTGKSLLQQVIKDHEQAALPSLADAAQMLEDLGMDDAAARVRYLATPYTDDTTGGVR